MFKNVLVICAGNICRSPTAEHLLRRHLAGADIRVSSAGLTAVVGHPIEPHAFATLQRHGQQPHEHQARQLTAELLQAADLVLTMEQRHLQDLFRQFPESRGKSFLLGKWQHDREIPDPYRQGQAAFEHAYALIEEGADAWSRRLQPQR
ncbi:low molecular weight protein-tyrosine-phosphatase [Pseudomonas sp. GCEP-101]|uniref:low molecular weight protein-tyrosine-phosphatase n=1 Tax=Pseudomonas sp. GCEP-101 TaxID=2974552 RepID=UPI00223AB630|nr:low molecular weight protein-tyrosine-phosphatase [Pseudomonas sp. GCEP-101]